MAFTADGIELPNPSDADLVGAWHIVQTTFPMWRNGKNTHPTLNYQRRPDSRLDDIVIYRRDNVSKQIRGIDTRDPALPCHFTWRGRGLLRLLSSDWYIVDLDREAGVMAIFFTKTLFTPAGLDIAARSPTPEPAAITACKARIEASAMLRPHLAALVELRHD